MPTDPDETPTEGQPAVPEPTTAEPAEAAAPQLAGQGADAPPWWSGAPAGSWAGPGPGGYPPPGAVPPPWAHQPFASQPFAPQPREPWVNPAKRGALTLIAVVLALVLLGGGFAIGAVAAHHRDGVRTARMGPYGGVMGRAGFGMRGPRAGLVPGYRSGGLRRVVPGTGPGTLPQPAQSPSGGASSSTSHR